VKNETVWLDVVSAYRTEVLRLAGDLGAYGMALGLTWVCRSGCS
jgi:hypothetical protein